MNRMSRIIFIVGMPRGGTTLMRLCLNSLDGIFILPETQFMLKVYGKRRAFWASRFESLKSVLDTPYEAKTLDLSDQFLDSLEHESLETCFLSCMREASKDEPLEIVGEKDPVHTFFVRELLRWYPNSRIIALDREMAPVVASFLKRIDLDSNLYGILARLVLTRKEMRKFKDLSGVLTVRYDKLIDSPEDELRRVCRFVGMPFDPKMLKPGRTSSYDESCGVGVKRDRSGITKENSEKWRSVLSEKQISLIEEIDRGNPITLFQTFLVPAFFIKYFRMKFCVWRAKFGVLK